MLIQDDGYTLQLREEEIVVRGAVVAFCGDTPASCFIGGFKEGVGFSLRKCRRCMATVEDMAFKVRSSKTISTNPFNVTFLFLSVSCISVLEEARLVMLSSWP